MADVISLKVLVDTVKGLASIKKMSRGLDGLGNSSKSTDRDLNKLKQELMDTNKQLTNAAKDTNTTEKEFRELSSKASFLAKKIKTLEKNSEAASKDVEDIGESAKGSQSKISGLVSSLKSFLGVAALIATAKKGIGIASEFEDYRNTLEVVTKDTKKAKEMFAWAVKTANKSPFETDEMIEGTVRLTSYGLSAKKTMGYIGDMAAVMKTDLMQAIEAVSDAQTGELERLKEYGITKEMIVKQANSMGMNNIVNNKGQITDLKKFNEALFALMNSKFEGGMARKAKTFSGAMSTINGVVKTSLATLMGMKADGDIAENSIFDVLRGGAVSLANALVKLQEEGKVGEFGKELGSVLKGTVELFKILYPLIAVSTSAYIGYKSAVLAAVVATKLQVGWNKITTAYTIAQAVATGQLSIANGIAATKQMLLNGAMAANPIGLAVAGIAGLIAGIYLLWKHFDKVKSIVLKAWEALDNNPLGKVFKFFMKWLNPLGQIINSFRMLHKLYQKFKSKNKVEIEVEESVLPKGRPKGPNKRPKPRPDGSHRTGLSFVPRDGYIAELHKGERVLTKEENQSLNSGSGSSKSLKSVVIEKLIGEMNFTVNKMEDIEEIADKLVEVIVGKLEIALANI